MRGKTLAVALFFALTMRSGYAADMSLQFGAMPGWSRQGVTIGAGLLFPRTITEFLTPELTLAYWSVGESAVVYSPLPGEYDPPYFHWGHPYDGPWGAITTGLRLNIENAWPLLPKFFACGVGVSQFAAWKSDDTVHDNTYGADRGLRPRLRQPLPGGTLRRDPRRAARPHSGIPRLIVL